MTTTINPFFKQAEINESANMLLEANMHREIGNYYAANGKDKTIAALVAHIDNSKHECEAWGRLFFRDAITLLG